MVAKQKKRTIVCQQAVYTSKDTEDEQGYQIVAHSPDLSSSELAQIQENSTIAGLIPFDYSFSEATRYYILPNGKVCCARMINAGADSLGRPNRIHTHTLVFEEKHFRSVMNNPFLVDGYLEKSILQKDSYEKEIEPLEIPVESRTFDYSSMKDLTDVMKTKDYLAGMLSAVISGRRIYILMDTQRDERSLLYLLVNCFPADLRPKCTFSTFTLSPENKVFNIVISPVKAVNFSEYTISDDYWVANLTTDYCRNIRRSQYADFVGKNIFEKNHRAVQSHIGAMERFTRNHAIKISFENIDLVHGYLVLRSRAAQARDVKEKVGLLKKCAHMGQIDFKSNSVAIENYVDAVTAGKTRPKEVNGDVLAGLYLALLNTMIQENDGRVLHYLKEGLLCFESAGDLGAVRTIISKFPEMRDNREILGEYQSFLVELMAPEKRKGQMAEDMVSLFLTTYTVFKKAGSTMDRELFMDTCVWGYEKSENMKENGRTFFLKGCMDTVQPDSKPGELFKDMCRIFDYPRKSLDWKYQFLRSLQEVSGKEKRYSDIQMELFREGYNVFKEKDRARAKYFIDCYESHVENMSKASDKAHHYDEIKDMFLGIGDFAASTEMAKKRTLHDIKSADYKRAGEAIVQLARFGVKNDILQAHENVFWLLDQLEERRLFKEICVICQSILAMVPGKEKCEEIHDRYLERLLSSTLKIPVTPESVDLILNCHEIVLTGSNKTRMEDNRRAIKNSGLHVFLNELQTQDDTALAHMSFCSVITFFLRYYGEVPAKVRRATEGFFSHLLSTGQFARLDAAIYELSKISEREAKGEQRFDELLRKYALKLYREWIHKDGLRGFIEDRPTYEEK